MAGPSTGARRALSATMLAAILGLAGWVRVSGHQSVLGDETIRPLTNDATYHMRRALETVRDFPHVPVRDALLGWPRGDDCPWAPGYDLLSALAVIALGAGGDERAAATVIVFVPVVLGLLVVWLTGTLARTLATPASAGAATDAARVLAAGVPIAIFSSQLGRVDHHVTEAISVLLLLGVALARVGAEAGASASRAERVRLELATATAVGFGLFVWTGSTLYVVMTLLVLAAATLLAPTRAAGAHAPVVGSGALGALLGAVLGLVSYAGTLRARGLQLSYFYPSPMQPGIVALAAVGLLALVLAARRVPRPAGGPLAGPVARRAVLAIAIALPPYALAWPLLAELWAGARDMLQVTGGAPSTVVEFQPLVRAEHALEFSGWDKALRYFGALAFVGLPLAALGISSVARRSRAQALVLGYFTVLLVVLTARQSRFARELAPVLAIAAALGIERAAELVVARVGSQRARAGTGRALALGIALLLVLSAEPTSRRLWPSPFEPARGAQAAGLFLARLAKERPDGSRAGALTDSFSGAFLMWPGRVPVVANNLLPKPEVTAALAGDEAGALGFMHARDLGWFVPSTEQWALMQLAPGALRLITLRPDGRGVIDPRFLQRAPLATAALGGGGIPEQGVPHLTALMPRFASTDGMPGLAFFLPSAWVYERVTGARVHGRATPSSLVLARIELRAHGRPLPYTAWTRADESGAFELRLPVPSGLREGGLVTAAHYAIGTAAGDAEVRRVEVPERAVRAGTGLELSLAPVPSNPRP